MALLGPHAQMHVYAEWRQPPEGKVQLEDWQRHADKSKTTSTLEITVIRDVKEKTRFELVLKHAGVNFTHDVHMRH